MDCADLGGWVGGGGGPGPSTLIQPAVKFNLNLLTNVWRTRPKVCVEFTTAFLTAELFLLCVYVCERVAESIPIHFLPV